MIGIKGVVVKKTKAQKAVRLFHYWCGRLQLPKTIPTRRDLRINCTFALSEWETQNPVLLYNTRRLGHKSYYRILSDIFHEIGHLKNKLPYGTTKQIVESEYQAEKFSVEMMKKHYKKQYQLLLKWLERRGFGDLHKRLPDHYNAFMRIKDYREAVERGRHAKRKVVKDL